MKDKDLKLQSDQLTHENIGFLTELIEGCLRFFRLTEKPSVKGLQKKRNDYLSDLEIEDLNEQENNLYKNGYFQGSEWVFDQYSNQPTEKLTGKGWLKENNFIDAGIVIDDTPLNVVSVGEVIDRYANQSGEKLTAKEWLKENNFIDVGIVVDDTPLKIVPVAEVLELYTNQKKDKIES